MTNSTVNEWYVFEHDTIDKATCNKIKKWAKGKWQPSSVDTSKGITKEERKSGKNFDYKADLKTRISDVAWCNEQWIFDLLFPYMYRANEQAGWKYDIKGAESAQITRYQKGGFYGFHSDGTGDHLSKFNIPDNKFLHGHVRKLSMSLMLNDNFDGGAFEFACYSKEVCEVHPIKATRGSIIIFPSAMEHRVAPVIKGTRYSVVIWFVGPPFV